MSFRAGAREGAGPQKPPPDAASLHLSGLSIRAALPDDAPAIQALLEGSGDAFPGWDADAVLARVLRELSGGLVAERRGDPVGLISCWQDEMLGVIGAHVVAGPCRGLGAGGALLEEAVRGARERGLRLLEVRLQARMRRALHLYERHRFRPVGGASPDGWIRFERRLGGPT